MPWAISKVCHWYQEWQLLWFDLVSHKMRIHDGENLHAIKQYSCQVAIVLGCKIFVASTEISHLSPHFDSEGPVRAQPGVRT